jgi:hypothetical protein
MTNYILLFLFVAIVAVGFLPLLDSWLPDPSENLTCPVAVETGPASVYYPK